MTAFLPGVICWLVSVVALGTAGAMGGRGAGIGWRLATAAVGLFSAIAGTVLMARVGGIAAFVFASSALTLAIGASAIVWFFVSVVNSAEEMLTPRHQPSQAPDFQFLHEKRLPAEATGRKKPVGIKPRFDKARERIAKLEFLNGWSFMRRPPQ